MDVLEYKKSYINIDNFQSPQGKHPATFIIKKTEKICSALHLITTVLYNTEPFRCTLRSESVMLVTRAATLSQNGEEGVSNFVATGNTLCALIQAAAYAGVVNADIVTVIIDELIRLNELAIDTFMRAPQSGLLATAQYYEVESIAPQSILHTSTSPKNEKDITQSLSHTEPLAPQQKSGLYSESAKTDKTNNRNKKDKKDRRATILTILQTERAVTVKDIAAIITDCSEKTIQRELLTLVAQGILKKEGERRWSMYSIK